LIEIARQHGQIAGEKLEIVHRGSETSPVVRAQIGGIRSLDLELEEEKDPRQVNQGVDVLLIQEEEIGAPKAGFLLPDFEVPAVSPSVHAVASQAIFKRTILSENGAPHTREARRPFAIANLRPWT
jgi:hypothetical protein